MNKYDEYRQKLKDFENRLRAEQQAESDRRDTALQAEQQAIESARHRDDSERGSFMDERKRISADEIRGKGAIEANVIASVLNAGDASAKLFSHQLTKPLSTEEIELMLSNQAILLNAVGNRKIGMSADLSHIATRSEIKEICDRWFKDGLKAFELSRKCLTALNEVRNPKRSATFVKQQLNQINLGDHNGSKTVDRLAESKTESFNPNMATLETVHRREDSRG